MLRKFKFNYLFLDLKIFYLKLLFINFIVKLYLKDFKHDWKPHMFMSDSCFRFIPFLFVRFPNFIAIIIFVNSNFEFRSFVFFNFMYNYLNFKFNFVDHL